MSWTNNTYAERSAYQGLNRRTIDEIRGRIVKKGGRNFVSRLLNVKGDRDSIASWRQTLVGVLHVFTVRLVGFVWRSLTAPFQAELAISNRVVLQRVHRDILANREGAHSQHRSVCTTPSLQQNNADHRADPSQVSDSKYNKVHSLMFS